MAYLLAADKHPAQVNDRLKLAVRLTPSLTSPIASYRNDKKEKPTVLADKKPTSLLGIGFIVLG
jgi:hypothetical protein